MDVIEEMFMECMLSQISYEVTGNEQEKEAADFWLKRIREYGLDEDFNAYCEANSHNYSNELEQVLCYA